MLSSPGPDWQLQLLGSNATLGPIGPSGGIEALKLHLPIRTGSVSMITTIITKATEGSSGFYTHIIES